MKQQVSDLIEEELGGEDENKHRDGEKDPEENCNNRYEKGAANDDTNKSDDEAATVLMPFRSKKTNPIGS